MSGRGESRSQGAGARWGLAGGERRAVVIRLLSGKGKVTGRVQAFRGNSRSCRSGARSMRDTLRPRICRDTPIALVETQRLSQCWGYDNLEVVAAGGGRDGLCAGRTA